MPPNQSTIIVIYKPNLPSAATLYDTIFFKDVYDNHLFDVSGSHTDFVTYSCGPILNVVRQY
jgi:hypothetical protein